MSSVVRVHLPPLQKSELQKQFTFFVNGISALNFIFLPKKVKFFLSIKLFIYFCADLVIDN